MNFQSRMTCQMFNFILDLDDHEMDAVPLRGHKIRLIKLVIDAYSKVRVHHLAKIASKKSRQESIRKSLTKTIHFKNCWLCDLSSMLKNIFSVLSCLYFMSLWSVTFILYSQSSIIMVSTGINIPLFGIWYCY